MNKAVQEAVQGRDGAVQAEKTYTQIVRPADHRALLVSERTTVFDRPRADLAPVDPSVEISDPIWDHAQGTRWTPDLVHCRLVVVGEITMRLPGHMRRQLVSVIGTLSVSENAAERKAPPTAAEISLANWTWEALFTLPRERFRLLQSRAFSISYAKISEAMLRQGVKHASVSAVKKWDIDERRALAGVWQGGKHPVDRLSFDRWRTIFERAPK